MPPSVDKFSEEFAGCTISSLINFFSGYYQVKLDEASRDLTAFMTHLGRFQMITLAQGATNSVAQFVRIVLKILATHPLDQAKRFLNDVGVKRPKNQIQQQRHRTRD